MYFLQKKVRENPAFIAENLADICASIQHTLVNILLLKLKKASKETGIKEIAIAGGVSANSGLRTSIIELGTKLTWKVYIPEFEYCTDNAAMIAMAANYKFLNSIFSDQTASPEARMEF